MRRTEARRVCPLCRGTQEPGETTIPFELGDGVMVIRRVPAWVCDTCEDTFIDNGIARVLEAAAEDARARGVQLEVIGFAQLLS